MNEILVIDKYGSKRKCLEKDCECCGKTFLARKDFLRRGRGRFCCVDCKNKNKRKTKVHIICAACGKIKEVSNHIAKRKTKYGHRFCSLKCKNKSQCIGGLIEPPHYKKKSPLRPSVNPDGKCLFCKKDLNRTQRKFCSHRCQWDFEYKEYISKWKNGLVSGNHNSEENLALPVRRYMLEKANYKCEKCSWNEKNFVTGKSPLNINHIDGYSSNSVESNLEVLCPNCHSLTPNYGSLNKGKGRKRRLQRLYKK